MGLGSVALASLLNDGTLLAAPSPADPLAPQKPHFPPKAKNVIYLFMAGGPSQLDLFDYKQKLVELNGQEIPKSYLEGKRFAFMNSSHGVKLLGTRRKFAQHGKSGAWMSDLLPHTAGIADDISIVTSCSADLFNHAPAKLFMNTGSGQFGRPSMGAWVTYGLGSESRDLPGFVVLKSGPRGPRGGAVNWASGFLPTTYQGVSLRGQGEAILDLSSPAGITAEKQRATIDAVRDLNLARLVETLEGSSPRRHQALGPLPVPRGELHGRRRFGSRLAQLRQHEPSAPLGVHLDRIVDAVERVLRADQSQGSLQTLGQREGHDALAPVDVSGGHADEDVLAARRRHRHRQHDR